MAASHASAALTISASDDSTAIHLIGVALGYLGMEHARVVPGTFGNFCLIFRFLAIRLVGSRPFD